MSNMAVKVVKAYLESQKIHPEEVKENLLRCVWQLDNTKANIFILFDDTDTHVHLEGLGFLTVPKDKREDLGFYKVLNEMNDNYRHVKFVLNEEGEVVARDDDVITLETAGEECEELMVRMIQIIDDAYPKFMKAIWA